MIRSVALAFAALATLLASTGSAADNLPATAADFMRLPAYCAARLRAADPESERRWGSIIGGDFIHIHHYCFGLHKRNLARMETDPERRLRLWKSVIGEYNYVLQAARSDFMLRAEILTQRSKAHVELGAEPSAIEDLKAAIQTQPDYEPAYRQLARLLRKMGQDSAAAEVERLHSQLATRESSGAP